MSRYMGVIDRRVLVYGFDLPCKGYFATIYKNKDEMQADEDEAYARVGFYPGVSLHELLGWLSTHGITLDQREIDQLEQDEVEATARGLSSVQKMVQEIMGEIEW